MSRSRVAKVFGIALGGFVALLVTAVLAASVVLQGPRLGALVQGALPENRGKLQIGGIGWSLRALADLITDAPSPISLDGLKIIDPEGTVVLDVPHLEARVKLRTLIGGSFSIHDLKAGKALWRFAQMNASEGIGFLAALESKHPAPAPTAGAAKEPQGPGSFFKIENADLGDLNVIFDFPGVWGLELRHARASASLTQSNVDPKHPIFGFDAGPIVAEGGGWLRIMEDNLLPFDKVIINRIATTQDRSDDIFLDLREARTGKTALVGKGYFTGIYGATSVPGADLHVEFHDAADAFNKVVAGKKIEGLLLSGDASAVADLSETFAKLKVSAKFAGLDVAYDQYRALGVRFGLTFDGDAMKIGLKDFRCGAPGGGTLRLGALFDANKMKVAADLSLKDFTTDSYLPPGMKPFGGGRVNGGLHADADLGPAGQSVAVRRLDLTLERGNAGGLPRTIRVHGEANVSPARLRTGGLMVDIPGANAKAAGEVKLVRQTAALAIEVAAYDLARVLTSVGLPPLGKTAELRVKVDGPFSSPTAAGSTRITGLGVGTRKVPELRATFGLDGGLARLDAGAENLFGGPFRAHGTVRLYEKSTRRMLKVPMVDMDVTARHIDLAAATGGDVVSGKLSFDAHVKGPVDALSGSITVPGNQPVVVAGEALTVGPIDVALDGRTVTIKRLHLGRRAGGAIDLSGTAGLDQTLALDLELSHLTLAGLPGIADSGVEVRGELGARLHVAGTVERPLVSGVIDLKGIEAQGIRLGDGRIEIGPDRGVDLQGAPTGALALLVSGDLFGRFKVDAQVAQKAAGLAAHASVTFTRVMLESLIPQMAALSDAQGVTSGQVQVNIEPGRPLAIDLTLTELWGSLARTVEGTPGEPTKIKRVEVRATNPVRVRVLGERVALDELSLATNGGNLHAQGVLDGKKLDGALRGHVDLELAQPFLGSAVDKLSGALEVAVSAAGSLDKPILRGSLSIGEPVRIRPKEFDSDIIVARGTITLDPEGAAVKKLAITVDGPTMEIDGRLTFGAGFKPESIDAHVAGEVSARLLAYAAAEAVTEARGRARIKADVKGRLDNPVLTAWLGLGTVSFRLRDTGTLIEVQSGVAEVSNSGVLLRDVRVLIDDTGRLVIGAAGVRPGQLEIRRLVPLEFGRLDFPLHGERLTYRSPGTFEVNDLAFDLVLAGDLDDGFELGGEVRVISGRYVQDFKLSNLVLSPRVNESAVRPFYQGKPLLEGLALDLTVRTVGDAFVVQNNIAPEIHIDIALHVGGTLSEPRLAGDVRPTDGRFRIPVLRGDFDLVPNVNHVTFVETKSLAAGDTPDIRIEAQNPVIDAAGVEHLVNMNIHGPVREMQIDLSTSGGLDRNQTAFLLLTGRTTTANDRLTTQNPTVGANVNTGLDIAGQATRDTIANLMEPIIGDTFERVVGAQLRLTVGPDGFEGRVTKRISRYTKFQLEALQGFQGTARQKLQFDQWLRDYITLSLGAQRLVISQQPGLNENPPLNASLELRWDFAIRR